MKVTKLIVFITLFFLFLSNAVFAKTDVIAYKVETLIQTHTLQVLGSLKAFQSTHMFAPVSEQLKKIHITDGQFVEKNQLLYEFNDAQEQALLNQTQLEAIESKRQYQRLLDIKDSSLVTQAQIDEKYTAWQTAISKQTAIEVQISDRKVVAPFSGQLGFSDVSIGNRIQAGEGLISLDDVETMKLDVLVSSQYLAQIQIGQPIQVNVEAYPKDQFKGHIVAVSPQLESQTRMVKVRAHIDNPSHKLKTNMIVKAHIKLANKPVLSVPNTAVIMLGDHNYVYRLLDQNGQTYKAEKIKVQTGQIGERLTEIVEGLSENDLVVSQGVMRIKPKSVLTIKGFENNQSQVDLLSQDSTLPSKNKGQ